MADDPYRNLLLRYEQERPGWESVAAWVQAELEEITRSLLIPAVVTGRTKELHSLVLKAYDKQDADLSRYRDKAAARVAVYYEDHIEPVVAAILEHFECPDGPDDKRRNLRDYGLGYRGVHCDVWCDRNLIEGADAATGELWCEVQVHTMASALWAATGHPLSYKPPTELSLPVSRGINRLSAVAELYDSELVRLRDAIAADPNYRPGKVLQVLERHYYGLFGGRSHNETTSRSIIERLVAALSEDEFDQFDALMTSFVSDKRSNLEFIYRQTDPAAHRVPLLMQPEALFVFERLERNAPLLREVWMAGLPPQWYDDLVAIWGGES